MPSGRDQGRTAGRTGNVRCAEVGSGQSEESTRCTDRPRNDFDRYQPLLRHEGSGRSDPAPDFSSYDLGRQSEKDAIYLNFTPPKNDGKTTYKLTVKDVPVDGFWSISLYNADGYFQKNDLGAYSFNNITAKKNADGSMTIQFGGCDSKIAELPSDHAGLELHGAPLSSAEGNPRRHLEVPGGAAAMRHFLGKSNSFFFFFFSLPPDIQFHEDIRLLVYRPKGRLRDKATVNKIVFIVCEDLEAKIAGAIQSIL